MSAVRQFKAVEEMQGGAPGAVRIALAGNPNCGKTTVFNGYTGARQHVGNYPGVTVDRKEGRFVFEKERLENIMNTISRWYNINVSYEDQAVKDILFTGNIKRYGDLEQVIEMLKLINKIDIEVKGNDVFIKDCQ